MSLVSGSVSETGARLARDHWDALHAASEPRAATMPSQGSMRKDAELPSVHKVDAAVMPAGVLHFPRADKIPPSNEDEIRRVARLDDEEARVSARPEVAGLGDPVGSKVDLGPKGSGAATIATVPRRQRLEEAEPWLDGR
ncbi:MAG: hypothetical protein K6T74_13590 [Geminicoccaceae bacterium]|nr:hypothetical protein [Geminicoccaceae bacterium]